MDRRAHWPGLHLHGHGVGRLHLRAELDWPPCRYSLAHRLLLHQAAPGVHALLCHRDFRCDARACRWLDAAQVARAAGGLWRFCDPAGDGVLRDAAAQAEYDQQRGAITHPQPAPAPQAKPLQPSAHANPSFPPRPSSRRSTSCASWFLGGPLRSSVSLPCYSSPRATSGLCQREFVACSCSTHELAIRSSIPSPSTSLPALRYAKSQTRPVAPQESLA